jgi:hypothetical protein
MSRPTTTLEANTLFGQVPLRNGVPESVLKKITPEMNKDAPAPPIVSPSMAKIDLARGRVTETIMTLRYKDARGYERAYLNENSPASWVSSAIEARGAHIGLSWDELGAILSQDPERVKGRANIRSACARVTYLWDMTHGVVIRWDLDGRFRIAKDHERERYANWFVRFLVGAAKRAKRSAWGHMPDPELEYIQALPLFGDMRKELDAGRTSN